MNSDNTITLYIVLRKSLRLDNEQVAYCAANAVQHILLKYFMMQLLAVKTHLDTLSNDDRVKTTTKWLASQSKKTIVSVNDDTWEKLKHEFSSGKDIFCLKNIEAADNANAETTLVFWPADCERVSQFLNE